MFESVVEACAMVDHDWIFTILRCFHQCIVQIFYSTFMNVIVVFKAQATAEVFDMFWIDNIDMSLVAEAFYNLLQAAIIVITLVRFECAVCTCTEVYNLFKVSWFDAVFQFVAISFRSCFRNIWCNTCYAMQTFSNLRNCFLCNDGICNAFKTYASTTHLKCCREVIVDFLSQFWCRWVDAAHG